MALDNRAPDTVSSVMTETLEVHETQETPRLSPVAQKFILHWGEMGTRWGVNRTVAQIHALLYLSQRPMPADEIADTLAVARSNVSTSLRELQGWRIVRVSDGDVAPVAPGVTTWSEYRDALAELNRGGAEWVMVPDYESV